MYNIERTTTTLKKVVLIPIVGISTLRKNCREETRILATKFSAKFLYISHSYLNNVIRVFIIRKSS